MDINLSKNSLYNTKTHLRSSALKITLFIGAAILYIIIFLIYKQQSILPTRNISPEKRVGSVNNNVKSTVSPIRSLAYDFDSCNRSEGALIFATLAKNPTSEILGYTNVPRCTIIYDIEKDPDLYQQCIRSYKTNSAPGTGMLNRNDSQKCFLDFYADPVELRPIYHSAVSLIFDNQNKNTIDEFLISKKILLIGVRSEGIYAKDLTENKQLWFYKTNNMNRFNVNPANNTLVTNIGGNDNFILIAINLHDGKELWKYQNLFFYPPFSTESGNIRIKIPEKNRFNRTILLDANSGSIIEDKKIDESWEYTISDLLYKDIVIKRDFNIISGTDSQTNKIIWEFKMKDDNSYTPISLKNIININSDDILLVPSGNFINAIDPISGKFLWSFCSRSIFRFSRIKETEIIFEAPDRNLYNLDISKVSNGETIDLFPNNPGLSCN